MLLQRQGEQATLVYRSAYLDVGDRGLELEQHHVVVKAAARVVAVARVHGGAHDLALGPGLRACERKVDIRSRTSASVSMCYIVHCMVTTTSFFHSKRRIAGHACIHACCPGRWRCTRAGRPVLPRSQRLCRSTVNRTTSYLKIIS